MTEMTPGSLDDERLETFLTRMEIHQAIKDALVSRKLSGRVRLISWPGNVQSIGYTGRRSKRDLYFDVVVGREEDPAHGFVDAYAKALLPSEGWRLVPVEPTEAMIEALKAEIERLLREREEAVGALRDVLGLVRASGDPCAPVLMVHLSPAQKLRQEAEEIEAADKTIRNARSVLSRLSPAEEGEP